MTCNATDDDHDGGGHDDGEAEAGCHPADAGAHGHDHLRKLQHIYSSISTSVCHPLAVADEPQRDAEAAPDQDAVHGARHVVVQGAAVDVPDGHQGAWDQHNGYLGCPGLSSTLTKPLY